MGERTPHNNAPGPTRRGGRWTWRDGAGPMSALVVAFVLLILREPWPLVFGGSGFAWIVVTLLTMTPRAPSPLDAADTLGTTDAAGIAVRDARDAIERLEAAVAALPEGEIASRLAGLAQAGTLIAGEVIETPAHLAHAQRVLIHHLPRTAELAEMLVEAPDTSERTQDEVLAVLRRLESVFAQTASDVRTSEEQALEQELRLLNRALDAEAPADRRPPG